ncbi:hypothetical protein [Streptacidiphilus anmyonensis]|uniref:hypothetical protein n=1 Tax=Streptacidiphilus anmyonensis TaxID=405782 RepID=UPI0005AB6B5A|nr:hypothetical protein [Streptacidiphilus anmyonensis]
MINLRRNRVHRRWTATDFESFEVLVSIGAQRPAALVTQARAPRPVRRAWRSALRTAQRSCWLLGADFQNRPAS